MSTRTLAEDMCLGNKGEILALQHHSLHQETPMKPLHIANESYHPPPRRKLPLQNPDLSPITGRPIHLMCNPATIGTPMLLSSHCSRERQSERQHPGPFYPSHNVPFNQSNILGPADGQQSRSPTDFHYIASKLKLMRDVSNIRRPQLAKPKITLSYPGSKNVTAKNQDSNKTQPSDLRSFTSTPQLHRTHVSPSLNTRAAEEVYPQQHSDCQAQSTGNGHCPPRYCKYPLSSRSSDRRSVDGVPIRHSSPARPDQEQQHKRAPSVEKSTPAVGSNCSSLKRRRESEDNISPSLVPPLKCSSDLQLQQRTTDCKYPPSSRCSDRSSDDGVPFRHSPARPDQEQQHKRAPSSVKSTPAVDSNCSSLKRRRESEDNSASHSLVTPLKCSSDLKLQQRTTDCKYPLSSWCSDRSSDDGVPIRHSPARPDQEQQHKRAPSSVKSTPAVDSNCSSVKRRRESEDNSASPSLVPPLKCSSDLKLQQRTTDSHRCAEQSSRLESSPCASVSTELYVRKAYITFSQDQIIKIRATPKPAEEGSLKETEVETVKKTQCSTLLSPKYTSSLPHTHSTSVPPVKTPRTNMDIGPKSPSKLNSGSLVERTKTARPRRHGVMPNYTDDLFTPDPISYVVSPAHKTAKAERARSTVKSTMTERSCSSTTSVRSNTRDTASSCGKSQNSTVKGFTRAEDTKVPCSLGNLQLQLPSVTLDRLKLENIPSCSKGRELKDSPSTFSSRQLQGTSVQSEEEHTTLFTENVTDTAASQEKSSHFPEVKKEAGGERNGKKANEEDSVDIDSVELDLDLSFALDVDLTQSSQSSEEEQLLSLQEMMKSVTKPPDTPEKEAFSEPSTPGNRSRRLRARMSSPPKPGLYKNNLDQLLKEINTNKKAKKSEEQLLLMCKEDLLKIAEYEEDQEQQEEAFTSEQQEFVQRFTLMSDRLREVPPGEAVFNPEKFGQIFNQDTLQLRKVHRVEPQGMAQKYLLWSSPAQLRSHVTMGLFQEVFDCQSPCPTQVSRFLFKMMSIHTERLISEKMLEVLCDIACTAARQIVESGSQQFKVWVPSLADVTLVLMNMGVPFVSLFPFENLQPKFTEGDLLDDVYIKSENPSHSKEQKTVPEHNYSTILKYLSLCMGLCPRVYSDDELLLLLAVLGRVSLDTQLILRPTVELFPLQFKIINNFRDWKSMLPRICLALTDLTDDHHNMCLLVQQLPDNKRGKQLRQHLSLSMISKLLNGKSTYRPTEEEFQLSTLRPYLPSMQPSTIARRMLSSSSWSLTDIEEDRAHLDQQSYYLCYSLLTLTNEASNFQSFPAHQNDQLLCLYSELDIYVKCDIRESEKCLYRSKISNLSREAQTSFSPATLSSSSWEILSRSQSSEGFSFQNRHQVAESASQDQAPLFMVCSMITGNLSKVRYMDSDDGEDVEMEELIQCLTEEAIVLEED